MVNFKKTILNIALGAFLFTGFGGVNLNAGRGVEILDAATCPDQAFKGLRIQMNSYLSGLKPDYDSGNPNNNIASNVLLDQIRSKKIYAQLNPGSRIRLSSWWGRSQDSETSARLELFKNFQSFEKKIKENGYSIYSRVDWDNFAQLVTEYSYSNLTKEASTVPKKQTESERDELIILASLDSMLSQVELSKDGSCDDRRECVNYIGLKDQVRKQDIEKKLSGINLKPTVLEKLKELKSRLQKLELESIGSSDNLITKKQWEQFNKLLDEYIIQKKAEYKSSLMGRVIKPSSIFTGRLLIASLTLFITYYVVYQSVYYAGSYVCNSEWGQALYGDLQIIWQALSQDVDMQSLWSRLTSLFSSQSLMGYTIWQMGYAKLLFIGLPLAASYNAWKLFGKTKDLVKFSCSSAWGLSKKIIPDARES